MKKCWIVLLCLMCVLVVGCQKNDNEVTNGNVFGELKNKDSGENLRIDNSDTEEIINSGNTSGELEINESNKGSESGEDILITPTNKDEFVGEKKYIRSDFVIYFFPDSESKRIEKDELMSLDLDQLEKAKNEIFARHGHDFSSEYLKGYFKGKNWYKPVSGKKVTVSELNEIEQINVNLIDNVIKEKKDFYTKEDIIEYTELMDILGRKGIVEINFIDSNAEKFDKKYDKKAYTTFNCQDKIEVYFLDSDLGSKVYFVSNGPIELLNGKYMFSSFSKCKRINGIELLDTSKVTNMFGMFSNCNELKELDLKKFNTSNVTDMAFMFLCCENLTTLDLTSFDTSKVEDMAWMFRYCRRLTELNVSSFDTSNVKYMVRMFSLCYDLENLDVSEFNTAKCISMLEMFSGSSKVRYLELSNFDTRNVEDMSSMFKNCSALTYLNLDNFDTSKVKDMSEMFLGCRNLENLDLSNFNTTNVTKINDMFKECTNLEVLQYYYLSEEIISSYDLNYLTRYELELVKYEIYARNGCEIDDKVLAQYFMSKDWYKPISGKKVAISELNEIEQENVNAIDKEIERQKKNPFQKIKILKKINTDEIFEKYEADWDTEKNKYPLEQKYLLSDTYENKEFGIEKIEVYFCGYTYECYYDPLLELVVNGVKETIICPSDIYIIDLDEKDNDIEIAYIDYSENHSETEVIRFVNNKFVNIGTMLSMCDTLEEFYFYDGKIFYEYIDFPEGAVIPAYWTLENNKLIKKITKYEDVKDNVYTVTEEFLKGKDCERELKVGDKIRILNRSDGEEEIIYGFHFWNIRVMNEDKDVFMISERPAGDLAD